MNVPDISGMMVFAVTALLLAAAVFPVQATNAEKHKNGGVEGFQEGVASEALNDMIKKIQDFGLENLQKFTEKIKSFEHAAPAAIESLKAAIRALVGGTGK